MHHKYAMKTFLKAVRIQWNIKNKENLKKTCCPLGQLAMQGVWQHVTLVSKCVSEIHQTENEPIIPQKAIRHLMSHVHQHAGIMLNVITVRHSLTA